MVEESLSGTDAPDADAERTPVRPDLVSSLSVRPWRGDDPVPTSVIIVLYRTPRAAFAKTLSALARQSDPAFEVIIVDNGVEWDIAALVDATPEVTVYAELTANHGVTIGRNVGAEFAAGEVLLFLDDDAVPHDQFVRRHLEAHADGAIATRGRVLPRGDRFFNRLQQHYDLGDEPFPFLLNTEGNLAVDAAAFRAVGGFDEALRGRGGHEGVLLTRDLLQAGVAREEITYIPGAVIYHDYCDSLRDYVRKEVRRRRTEQTLRELYPQLMAVTRRYDRGRDSELSLGERLQSAALRTVVRVAAHVPGLVTESRGRA